MLKVSDLRVGSWVKTFESETPVRIDENMMAVDVCRYGAQDIRPIPLTPAIMKANFECLDATERYGGYLVPISDKVKIRIQQEPSGRFYWFLGGHKVRTDFIHQLQDLYRALAGKELEIKIVV